MGTFLHYGSVPRFPTLCKFPFRKVSALPQNQVFLTASTTMRALSFELDHTPIDHPEKTLFSHPGCPSATIIIGKNSQANGLKSIVIESKLNRNTK